MGDRTIGLLYVLTSIILESAGQISLKQAAERNSAGRNVARMLLAAARDKWLIGGIVCFILEFVSWTFALQRLDVSLAFQLSSLTYVAVAVSLSLAHGTNNRLSMDRTQLHFIRQHLSRFKLRSKG